jgi:hypothetical protein
MKPRRVILITCAILFCVTAAHADDWMDNLDESLRVSFFKGAVTAQLSGLLDLEGYYIEQPPTALYTAGGNALFNPRLTFNLDAQITPAIYAFAEARVDRGFDPSDRNLEARFDQYAISYKPWNEVPFSIQAGKFASVVGTYAERSDSWTNPFINAPLPYENLTAIFDDTSPASPQQLIYWRYGANDVYERVPIMWGPSYASGIAMFGQLDQLDLAAEVKNASLSSRPETWDFDAAGLDHPTWSGHADWRPSPTWRFGLSASIGPYLRPGTGIYDPSGSLPVFPDGHAYYDYDQSTIAQDITFAWRHWQLWAEFFETRFDVPRVGNAGTFAYYIEAKYKFTPQFFGALRWNQEFFSTIPLNEYQSEAWGTDTSRIDAAFTYRWTVRLQTKLQYSFIDQNLAARREEHLVAGQVTVNF